VPMFCARVDKSGAPDFEPRAATGSTTLLQSRAGNDLR
jgi:hypothetical protein